MQRSVSAREANQHFSRILRDVEAGAEIVVTRRATRWRGSCRRRRLVNGHLTAQQEAAYARSMERLRKGWALGGGRFSRDELYDD